MREELETTQTQALQALTAARTPAELEECRIAFLGKKGHLTQIATRLRDLSPEEKPAAGQLLNAARQEITRALDERQEALQDEADRQSVAGLDVTLPPRPLPQGSLHPLTLVRDRAIRLFRRLGFALAEGPEIETPFHCFDALNTPKSHPARNDSDTFYFDSGKLLRTHTSSVQVRAMETQRPPLRIIAPGSAYRRDEIDATHLSVFTQLEGLYVAPDVRLSQLKGTLEFFLQSFFGPDTEVRFRPHFFPFTEPSFEIDVKLQIPGEAPKWIEVAGCGMVDPAVFEALCKSRGDDLYHPESVQGFAFGMGIERLTMILYKIPDIRALVDSDLDFLEQFRGQA